MGFAYFASAKRLQETAANFVETLAGFDLWTKAVNVWSELRNKVLPPVSAQSGSDSASKGTVAAQPGVW